MDPLEITFIPQCMYRKHNLVEDEAYMANPVQRHEVPNDSQYGCCNVLDSKERKVSGVLVIAEGVCTAQVTNLQRHSRRWVKT